jgi:excisionase family DNA binding protein
MVSIDKSEFCTVAQAAATLGVHPSTIWRWIDAERLPAYRIGPRSIRIKRSDLEQVVTPTKPQGSRVAHMKDDHTVEFPFVPRRLTPAERERALKHLDEVRKHTEQQLQRRGGQPFPDSWEEINQARDERSRHLLEL